MRVRAFTLVAALLWMSPARAQTDPVGVATTFLRSVLDGDLVAIRGRLTTDAVMVGGDVAVPLAGAEGVLVRPELRSCIAGPLRLKPEAVGADLLGLSSVKAGNGRMVEGAVSCPTVHGAIKKTVVRIVVVDGKVAVFGFE